jgi:hypothetical protein
LKFQTGLRTAEIRLCRKVSDQHARLAKLVEEARREYDYIVPHDLLP